MEIKTPETTRPSQELVSTNNGDFGQEISRSSYTCNFCKRGFSNAQALGGHMNVHRKDRAMLHESIQETLITTDSTKGINLNSNSNSNSIEVLEVQSSDDDKDESVPKRGYGFKKPTLQLSLWVEPSAASDSSIRSNRFSSLSPSSTEVDLELRLGMNAETNSRDHVVRD